MTDHSPEARRQEIQKTLRRIANTTWLSSDDRTTLLEAATALEEHRRLVLALQGLREKAAAYRKAAEHYRCGSMTLRDDVDDEMAMIQTRDQLDAALAGSGAVIGVSPQETNGETS